jgi:hypothetical protein
MKKTLMTMLALSSCLAVGTLAYAAVTFDATTGTGFVGKGEVQVALGLNNKELNAQAGNLIFAAVGTQVQEYSWECTNSNNDKVQSRERETSVTTQGVVSAVARDNKTGQITGFNLIEYQGNPTTQTTSSGQPLNSCPAGANWSLSTPAGEPVVIESSSVLTVDGVTIVEQD